MVNNTIDVVALCSTHLPIVKNYIEAVLPSIKLVNSSTEVARDVKNYLKYTGNLNSLQTVRYMSMCVNILFFIQQ